MCYLRPDDVPMLVDAYLREAGGKTVSPEVLDVLTKYGWPGNVRQLQNTLARALALGDDELTPDLVRSCMTDTETMT